MSQVRWVGWVLLDFSPAKRFSFSLWERVCLERMYHFPFGNNTSPLALSTENDVYRYYAGQDMLPVGESVPPGETLCHPNNIPDEKLVAGYNF